MKKLLTVLAASVGIAAFADTAPLSATSFENYSGDFSIEKNDAGAVVSEGRTWAGTTDAEGDTNVITAYGDATPPANRPDYYKEATTQEAFLKVDSTAGLARYVNADGVPQGLVDSNVYFDMDVQFTVSDSIQDPAPGDKLLVWLYAPDTEDAQTNLVITAATINSDTLVPTAVNYVAATPAVAADTWYRLTVVSTTKDFEGDKVPHFQVYIDGTQVVPSGTMDSTTGEISSLSGHDGLFGSLVQFDEDVSATKTLTSVTFKGTGAVDDLVVTTEKPSFIQPEVETMYFQVGEDTTKQYKTFAEALAEVAENGTIKVLAGVDGALEITTKSVVLDLNGNALTGDITVSAGKSLTVANTSTTAGTTAKVVVWGTLMVGKSGYAGAVTVGSVDVAEGGVVKALSTESVTTIPEKASWSENPGEDGYYTLSAGEVTYTFALSGAGFTATYALGTEQDEEIVYEDPVEYSEPVGGLFGGIMLKVVIMPAAGYTITGVTGTEVVPGIVDGVYTFEIPVLDSSITLAVSTTGGSSEKTHEIDTSSESLDANGALTVEDGTTKITLDGVDVTAGFTINETTATLKTPVIEANEVEGDANKDEPLVVTATEVKIGVKAVQGLYYGVGTNPDVTKVARPAKLIKFTGDNRAVIFTKDKTENVAGEFYKVYVDIKE